MKGFALKDNDILIMNNEIQLVDGSDLLAQTVQTVLNTNKGEWFLNEDEGINFWNILGKHKQTVESNVSGKYKTLSEKYKVDINNLTRTEKELEQRLSKRLDGVLDYKVDTSNLPPTEKELEQRLAKRLDGVLDE